MSCAYCRQQRQTLAKAVATGDIKTAVKTAAVGTGTILGIVSKPATPPRTTGHVAGKKKG
jgi:hypothetical protein